MFANTITVDVATGQPRILKRINQDNQGSEYRYQDAVETVTLKFRHNSEKAKVGLPEFLRHNVIVERVIYATATTLQQSQSVSITMRHPAMSSPADLAGVAKGIMTLLNTGTYLTDVSGGDN